MIYRPPPPQGNVFDFTQASHEEDSALLLEAHEKACFAYDMVQEMLELYPARQQAGQP